MGSSTAIIKIIPAMTALTTLKGQAKILKGEKIGVKKVIKSGTLGILGTEFVKLESGLIVGL